MTELASREEVSAPTRSVQWGGPTIVAGAVAVGQLLWFTVEMLRGYFWQDDFAFLYLAGTEPLGDLMLTDYNGHLQPGAFVASWLVADLAPLSWPAAALPMVALHAGALLLCWLFLVRSYGERWAIVVPFTVVAWSPLTFGLSMWWAYALQLLPLELALFGALFWHVSYLRRPAPWRAALAVLCTIFGLAFAEKAVLVPVVLFGVTLAMVDGDTRARLAGAVRPHIRLWLGYLLLLAGYVAVHSWRAPIRGNLQLTAGDLLSLIRSMIGDGLVPALFGGPWSADWIGLRGLAPPATVVLVVTWTSFAALVLVGLWLGRRRAVFAWLTLVVYLAVSVLLVSMARLEPWGVLIGTDPRYVADAVPVAVVCAALALLRPRNEAGGGARLGPAAAPPVALAAAFVVGAIATLAGAVPELRHLDTRDYVENVTAASRLEPNLTLYDGLVPAEMMLPYFGDYARASRVLHGLDLRFNQPSEDLRMLDGTGTPRKIGLVATVQNRPIPVPNCGYPVGQQITRVPLAERAEGTRLVVQFGYYTDLEANGTVSTPNHEYTVRFQPGLHVLSIVADGPFSEVLVQAEGAVCVTNVLVGLPLPHPS